MKLNCLVSVINKFFARTFSCFSLITVAMSLVGLILNTDDMAKYLAVNQILTFFYFSLLFALSFGICDLIKNSSVLRRTFQFVLTYASLVLVFFLGGTFGNYVSENAVQNKGFSILAISFMFVIIYVVCGIIAMALGMISKKANATEEEYKSIFENK